jgi:TPR repeat protein
MFKRTAIGLLFAALIVLPVAAQDFEKGSEALERGDYAAALKELRPLAEQGDARAQLNLGNIYYKGLGVTQDYAEAMKWYGKAADQGDAEAQLDVGFMYEEGQGVQQNLVLAYMWMSLAAVHFPKGSGMQTIALMKRSILGEKMTASQVRKAKKLAKKWLAEHGSK